MAVAAAVVTPADGTTRTGSDYILFNFQAMKKRRSFWRSQASLLLVGTTLPQAQIPSYAEEALPFSRSKPVDQPRIQGMGGVQNSLGGDLNFCILQSAGLCMYNRSDFAVTWPMI